jgi:hypothetical protein
VKLDEHLVLEFTIRFELLVWKGRSLQASAGSLESLNVDFF